MIRLYRDLMEIERRLYRVALLKTVLLEGKDKNKKALVEKGISLMVARRYLEAAETLSKLFRLELPGNEKVALSVLIGSCFWVQGTLNTYLEYRQETKKWWTQAFDWAEQIDDEQAQTAVLNNLGLLYSTPSERYKALEFFKRSLKIREKIADRCGIAQTCYNIGNLYWCKQSKAIPFYERALDIYEELGYNTCVARAYKALAYMYEYIYEFDVAITFWEKYLKIKEKEGDMLGVANAKGSIGYLFNKQGKKKESERFFKEVIEIRTGTKITPEMIKKHLENS